MLVWYVEECLDFAYGDVECCLPHCILANVLVESSCNGFDIRLLLPMVVWCARVANSVAPADLWDWCNLSNAMWMTARSALLGHLVVLVGRLDLDLVVQMA